MTTVAKDTFLPGFNFAAPIEHMLAVVPSDANEQTVVGRKLYIGGAGTITFVARGDGATPVTLTVIAGQVLDICVRKVLATGTTATGIVIGY